MNAAQTLTYAAQVLKVARYKTAENLGLDNFPQYAQFVAAVARDLTPGQKAKLPQLKEWAQSFRKLYDHFDQIVKADPMVLYTPKHKVAYEFHSSPASIRYFRGGNRTSKTQSGYAEHYFYLTNSHQWRRAPVGDTFIVGLEYTKYAPNVFERKMLTGEAGNPLSPMFPEGGKWFNHYDDRKRILTIGCEDCAETGKAAQCRHTRRTVTLFSDEGGWEVLQGAVYALAHFDEHVDEGFFEEAKMRLSSLAEQGSSLIITGTPLFGEVAWENRLVAAVATGDPGNNRQFPKDPESPPLVSLHQISMFDAGIVSKRIVEREMQTMDEFAIKCRIYGEPAPNTRNPVFDRFVLAEMRKRCRDPEYVTITPTLELEKVAGPEHLLVTPLPDVERPWTGSRIWERPQAGGQYIAAVDSARGLAGRDASCCSIIKLTNVGMKLKLTLVAQYHGWINAFDYGDEVFKLCVWYNSALAIVELTGGFGDPVMLRLKQLAYWNIFRNVASIPHADFVEDPLFGVDTNAREKPFMVAALQQMVRDRCIDVPCRDTIDEMANFAQEDATRDGQRLVSPRFRGAGGAHDDRVMSLVIGASVAVSTPVFDFQADAALHAPSSLSPEWQAIHKEIKDAANPDSYLYGV